MVKKETKVETTKEHKICCPDNVWMYVSIGLGVAFIIALIFAITNAVVPKDVVGGTAEQAGISLVNLINTTQPDSNAILLKSEEVSGLYKITVSVKDQNGEIYVTKDGKFIIPGVIDVATLKNNPKEDTNTPAESKIYTLPSIIGIPSIGKEDAKIQVYEFSDYQCPFCGLAYGSPWANEFKTQYGPMIGTTQKVEEWAKENKIAFKQFPVAINTVNGSTESIDASNAALCAGDQNKYWEMHTALFEAQTSKDEYTGKYAKPKLKILGQEIAGLDINLFNECVDKDTYVTKVKAMTQDAEQASYANVNTFGTPTFYIVLDASLGKEKIESVAKTQGYKVGPTSDNTKYVMIASPEFAKIKSVIDAFAS
ncbi:MAG: hypothetical protein COT14_02525 [Candidatus Diapherotrites archaeon CG08_land_8_20_14_0_20_30_16]|nr:MAG: hypothetical protein COT14_02525 [Candidatus Diapherotrites archaeon CG08_land_8_20_14_0_20_30_16]